MYDLEAKLSTATQKENICCSVYCILPPQRSYHVNISMQLESDLSYELVDWMGKAKCQDFLKKPHCETKPCFYPSISGSLSC